MLQIRWAPDPAGGAFPDPLAELRSLLLTGGRRGKGEGLWRARYRRGGEGKRRKGKGRVSPSPAPSFKILKPPLLDRQRKTNIRLCVCLYDVSVRLVEQRFTCLHRMVRLTLSTCYYSTTSTYTTQTRSLLLLTYWLTVGSIRFCPPVCRSVRLYVCLYAFQEEGFIRGRLMRVHHEKSSSDTWS